MWWVERGSRRRGELGKKATTTMETTARMAIATKKNFTIAMERSTSKCLVVKKGDMVVFNGLFDFGGVWRKGTISFKMNTRKIT